jgi:hypothetical protein
MYLKEKINLMKYSIGTLANALIITFLGSINSNQVKYQLLVLLGASLNQLMLLVAVKMMLSFDNTISRKNIKVFALMILKTFLLGATLYIAGQNVPEKVFACVFIYIFQLIILTLSIKRLSN